MYNTQIQMFSFVEFPVVMAGRRMCVQYNLSNNLAFSIFEPPRIPYIYAGRSDASAEKCADSISSFTGLNNIYSIVYSLYVV